MPKQRPTREQIEHDQMIEGYKLQLRDEELLARMNKATYEKMYYYIAASEIQDEYSKLVSEQQKKREENIQRAHDAVDQLKESLQGGELTEEKLASLVDNGPEPSGSIELAGAAVAEEPQAQPEIQ